MCSLSLQQHKAIVISRKVVNFTKEFETINRICFGINLCICCNIFFTKITNNFTIRTNTKEINKKRTAADHRKYQLGGAVIAAYKELGINIDTLTPDQVRKAIVRNNKIINKIEKSIIFEQIEVDLETLFFRWPIFLKVIDKLAMIEYDGEVVPEYIKEIYLALSECKAGKK